MDKDKNKINEEINKLMQNKKFVNCLIVLLVIIFLWLAVSNFIGDDAGLTKGKAIIHQLELKKFQVKRELQPLRNY